MFVNTYKKIKYKHNIMYNHQISQLTSEPTISDLHQLIVINSITISKLTSENESLRQRNAELERDKESYRDNMEKYKEIIDENKKLIKEHETNIEKLKEENIGLNKKIKLLEDHILSLETKIDKMEKEKEKFDALVKLHECNALVNKIFKIEYKKCFKPKRNEYIPNIGEIINDPPTKTDDEEYYNFWEEFKIKYPNSDDIRFRKIYCDISDERAINGAHVNIKYMTEDEFDKLIVLVYPEEYKKDPNLYKEYREWLFRFPVV